MADGGRSRDTAEARITHAIVATQSFGGGFANGTFPSRTEVGKVSSLDRNEPPRGFLHSLRKTPQGLGSGGASAPPVFGERDLAQLHEGQGTAASSRSHSARSISPCSSTRRRHPPGPPPRRCLKRMHFIHDRYSFEFLISDEIMLGSAPIY